MPCMFWASRHDRYEPPDAPDCPRLNRFTRHGVVVVHKDSVCSGASGAQARRLNSDTNFVTPRLFSRSHLSTWSCGLVTVLAGVPLTASGHHAVVGFGDGVLPRAEFGNEGVQETLGFRRARLAEAVVSISKEFRFARLLQSKICICPPTSNDHKGITSYSTASPRSI